METEEIQTAVRNILFRIWDPNIVSYNEKLADEYDAFVPEILAILLSGADEAAMEGALLAAEQAQNSYSNPANRRAAAKELAALGRMAHR